MPDSTAIVSQFQEFAVTCLRDNCGKIALTLAELDPEQVWARPNEVSNSIANLLIHLRGNITQWILCGLGGGDDKRDRRQEFNEREFIAPEALLGNLQETLEQVCDTISQATPEQLGARYNIQGYTVSGTEAVFHVVEHFSWHSGQILYAMKAMTGKEVRIYDEDGHRVDGRSSEVP